MACPRVSTETHKTLKNKKTQIPEDLFPEPLHTILKPILKALKDSCKGFFCIRVLVLRVGLLASEPLSQESPKLSQESPKGSGKTLVAELAILEALRLTTCTIDMGSGQGFLFSVLFI